MALPLPPVLVEALAKSFGGFRAVGSLSFEVRAGEIYGLLGPNGAGKTTALRMIAGLLSPDGGRALVAGIDSAVQPDEVKLRVGLVTSSTGLYARLTPRELLAHFGRVYGLRGEALATRTRSAIEALALEAFLDKRCETLSTGQRQRVSVARAVLHDPPVLILDEPTSGLDVLASRFLRDLVSAERARGKAIVFSTHYLAEAELLCDRVGLLHEGRLIREGTPAALRAERGSPSLEEAFLALVAETERRQDGNQAAREAGGTGAP